MALLPHLLAFWLVTIHLLAPKLRFLDRLPRSRWLSFAGGISIAYVFVHVLPDLHAAQHTLERAGSGAIMEYVEAHAYLVAMAGLCVFYGLEHLALGSRILNHAQEGADQTRAGVFWVHVASYGTYNALIGYLLLHREEQGPAGLIFFAIAIGLHFVVNDYGLREHHKHRYSQFGRWLLSAGILVGWGCGLIVSFEQAVVDVLFAFLAGGIIVNVIKEELPKERQSHFLAFASGVVIYTALLLIM